jgi:hypothetical protein
MKRLLLVVILCIVFAAPSFAQANSFRKFEINWDALAYTRQGGSNFAGGGLGFAYHVTRRWAILAEERIDERVDFSDIHLTTYRFGPRYTRTHGNRLTMFAEVLAGGALATRTTLQPTIQSVNGSTKTVTTTSQNGFAIGAGGGVDFGIRPWIAWRAVQAEYSFVHIGGNTNGVRIGTGLVFRFGK